MKFFSNKDHQFIGTCAECGGAILPNHDYWRRGSKAEGYVYEHTNCEDPDGSKAAGFKPLGRKIT